MLLSLCVVLLPQSAALVAPAPLLGRHHAAMLARPALLRHSLHLRAPPPTMEEQLAEEDETLEAVKIAGGLSAACIGFYTALTYGGVDDTLAGNLVLLALVAFGSYLLFFDGGATQAALEMQAVQEVCGSAKREDASARCAILPQLLTPNPLRTPLRAPFFDGN